MNVLCEEADRLAERVGHVVHDLTIPILLSLLDKISFGLLQEHAIGLDSAHQLVAQERLLHVLFRVHVVHLHVIDGASLRPSRKCFHQCWWLAYCLAYGHDAVAGDLLGGAVAVGKLCLVLAFVRHHFSVQRDSASLFLSFPNGNLNVAPAKICHLGDATPVWYTEYCGSMEKFTMSLFERFHTLPAPN